MTCVRVTFSDGVVYDYPITTEKRSNRFSLSMFSFCMRKASAWHKIQEHDGHMESAYITAVEWCDSYNFIDPEED